MRTRALANQDSELFSQSNTSIVHSKDSRSWLKQLHKLLSLILTVNDEPRIQKILDRRGNTIWRIYDPISNQTTWLNSETEVRIWFDRRFNS